MNSTASSSVSTAGSLLSTAMASSLTACDMVCPISSEFPSRNDSSNRCRRNFGQMFSVPPEHDDRRCATMRDTASSKDDAGSKAASTMAAAVAAARDDGTRPRWEKVTERLTLDDAMAAGWDDASRRPTFARRVVSIGSFRTTAVASRRRRWNISSWECATAASSALSLASSLAFAVDVDDDSELLDNELLMCPTKLGSNDFFCIFCPVDAIGSVVLGAIDTNKYIGHASDPPNLLLL
mmetsp:Transcript_6781/g.16694  ORF Transcript_6781/g.16694 Transcript_6781/m.16694 type:complete len:238 (+) Transcript_6781:223-936(+)